MSVQQLACVLTEAGLWRALAGLWRAFSQPMAWAEHAQPLLIARRCPACWTAPGAACRPQIRPWSSGIKQLLGLPAAPRRPAGRLSDAHPGCTLPLPQDVLWETGVAWAQRRAAGIFRDATEVRLSVEEQQAFVLMFVLLCLLACLPACQLAEWLPATVGQWCTDWPSCKAPLHAPKLLPRRPCTKAAAPPLHACPQDGLIRQHSHSSPDSLELNLHSTTVAVALLSLHNWLAELW